jgi:hypothetical protein
VFFFQLTISALDALGECSGCFVGGGVDLKTLEWQTLP